MQQTLKDLLVEVSEFNDVLDPHLGRIVDDELVVLEMISHTKATADCSLLLVVYHRPERNDAAVRKIDGLGKIRTDVSKSLD